MEEPFQVSLDLSVNIAAFAILWMVEESAIARFRRADQRRPKICAQWEQRHKTIFFLACCLSAAKVSGGSPFSQQVDVQLDTPKLISKNIQTNQANKLSNRELGVKQRRFTNIFDTRSN